MFTTYAQSMPLLEAAKKTFSGEELCDVCEVVQDARQDGQDESPTNGAAGTKALGKLPMVTPPGTLFVLRPSASGFRPASSAFPPGTPRAAPPTPPPRAAA
jgi:hypothetical protein